MKKTVLIYPFTNEYMLFVQKAASLDDVKELILVSPKGWGYEGEKVSFEDKQLYVSTEFETNCEVCDEVWFINTCFELDESKMISPKILFAQQHNKRIKNYRTVKSEKNVCLMSEMKRKQK